MRVELHRVSHDVRHLIISAVIHALHGVQDASLNRLQAVLDVRHGTLQDYVRCVIEEPVLVHSTKMVHRGGVETVHGAVVRVNVRDIIVARLLFSSLVVLFFVAVLHGFVLFVWGNILYIVVHD